MASRRRRRKSLGGVVTNVESRVRRIEKRPGSKRLKTNVVSTEKIQPRAVVTKVIAQDAVTPNEAAFGTTFVTDTQPTEFLKEGTTWLDPNTGSTQIYSMDTSSFIEVTDATARASANGKNTIYRQTSQPSGGTYVEGDTWFDSDDNNKIYHYNGTTWVAVQLGGNGLANINANSITTGTIDASVITVSNLDAGKITTGTLDAIKITSGGLTINANGSITTSSTKFGVDANGKITATDVDLTGEINATSGTFSGTITATGTISGGTISGATLVATNGGNTLTIDPAYNNATYTADGSTTYSTVAIVNEATSGTFSGYKSVYASDTITGGISSYVLSVGIEDSSASNGGGMQTSINSSTNLFTTVLHGDQITLASAYNFMFMNSTGVYLSDSTAVGTFGLRNIKSLSSSAGFTASTDTSGAVGDVMLIYTP